MQVFNVLDEKLNILGYHFLEASAGTGKTFAIENLVTRLIIQEPISIDQILVVTFTRAATRELKMRIRSNLEKACNLRKVEEALCLFDQAQVFTIHGFCHRMLTEFAFEAGVNFGLADPDDISYKALMRQEVKDFFRTQIDLPEYEEILKKYHNDTQQLENEIVSLLEENCDIIADTPLMKMAKVCQERWNKRCEHSDHITPDEILLKMEKCLDRPAFFARVVNKYKAAIIDEFQDTDPVQWNIFHRLFIAKKDKLAAFYLVGDPKQSIYSFRSADLYTYLKAAEVVGEKSYLDTNYRSSSGLVASLNRFFGSASWMELPALNKKMEFLDVKAAPHAEEEGGLHFFIVPSKPTREKSWPPRQLEEEFLFPYIACEIQKKPDDKIAILIKDRYQGQRLQSYLEKFNIKSAVKRGADLRETPEFISLETIFSAVDDPSVLKAALASPLIGWSAQDLLDEEKGQRSKQFFYPDEKSTGAFFQKLFQQFEIVLTPVLRQLVEMILQAPDPLQFLKELKQSKETIEIQNPEQDDRIVIMTTHMSKGLEFDTVFALGIASRHSQNEDFLKINKTLVSFDANHPQCKLATVEKDAEKLRQLYVALTRGKKSVYVPFVIDSAARPLPPGQASPIELFIQKAIGSLQAPEILAYLDRLKIGYEVLSGSLTPVKQETAILPPLKPKLEPLSFPPLFIQSFSSIAKSADYHTALTPGADELPLGAETGILIHALFEKIFFLKLTSNDKIRQLIEKETKGASFEGQETKLFQWIDQALHQDLLGFCLADVPFSQIMQEMEFLFPTQDMLMKGFADLCFEYQGKYYLLDWKTNWLENYSPASMEAAMNAHDYFLQASIYAEALHRYVKLFDTDLTFGGAFYFFLRGPAVLHFFPNKY